jgi:uncharacterized repeat protein (TIGR01451 family)
MSADEIVLHSFAAALNGAHPGAIYASGGSFYGATNLGGSANVGLVYKLDAAGNQTVLYNFAGGIDGTYPDGALIQDSAGNLYGTTFFGGTWNEGVVYKLDPTGHETILHSFSGADGGHPYAGVTMDSAGNLYGTTAYGGSTNTGAVFKVDTNGQETVLYSFTGGADGKYPNAGVIQDPEGNFYGTTSEGGSAGAGVVYKLDATGHETVLYSFTGGADGGGPSGVILDAAGDLYGTTTEGGNFNNPLICGNGCGVVFKVQPSGHESVLYSFTGGTDGGTPYYGVVRDSAGNLYGTSANGGTGSTGVVYKLDATGHETVLYNFTGLTDHAPSGVILDSAGNLYGATYFGGPANAGVVYKVDAIGQETVLYSFIGGLDGHQPNAGVIQDSAGNLYGTTYYGDPADAGVVYKVDATGKETVLYSFTGGADGLYPNSGLIQDSAGNLYGTTESGGAGGGGTVYKLDASGHQTVLHGFTGVSPDGFLPFAGVIQDSTGNLYGTTYAGGTGFGGMVYKLDATGNETVLYSFSGAADGAVPYAGVIRDSAGNLYGTTFNGGLYGAGVVYKLDSTGHQTVLHTFANGADGGHPYAGVIQDLAGNLYGTTTSGGPANVGVVYKVDATGHETVLYGFMGGDDGGSPQAGVIQDPEGNLYGTTTSGGPANVGVVYKVDATGHETVLYGFTGTSDGKNPWAGVIRDSAGNLYGTTSGGGQNSVGVVFKLTNAPEANLVIFKSHSGYFTQGQIGATYTIEVLNSPLAAAATSGTVTVTETVPTGLTLTGMAGPGWTCAGNSCTRSDPLSPNAIYPTITVTVNVALNALAQVTNQADVSAGNSAPASTYDPTFIVSPPSLSITKTHVGDFVPGQTGTYTVVVSNGAAAGPTNGTVTVTDSVQSGLTLVSMAGTGWNCPPGNSCTRSDVLSPGFSYPAITVTVTVAGNATSPVTNMVSVSGGSSATANASDPAILAIGLGYYVLTPCRIADTRAVGGSGLSGAFGPPFMAAHTTRDFPIPTSPCGAPSTAQAYAFNVTVIPHGPLGYLTAWPTGAAQPFVATLNSPNGTIIGNAAIMPAGTSGSVSLFVTNDTDVVIDITGYFAPPAAQALAFYPMTPCRVADTRDVGGSGMTGAFGPPSMAGGASRDFPMPTSSCGTSATAQAYSVNMTVIASGPLGYLTAWATGQTQPFVATLNAPQGGIVGNAAIVPAGTSGSISVFVTNNTDLVIDINSYFDAPGSPGALKFYPVAPCRVADTRAVGGSGLTGAFGPPQLAAHETRNYPIPSSSCGIPALAQAYSMNMTVVAPGPLGYLTAWPEGVTQPFVATLNAPQGGIIGHAAIVPAGTGGAISVFVTNPTDLVIDINGYFGP